MKIKKMNKIISLAFRNRLSLTTETSDNDGKNKAAVHDNIQIIAPKFKAEILFNLFDTLAHICKPTKALIWKGIGIHFAIYAVSYTHLTLPTKRIV